jgi:uncharacterized protein (DUF305 family)
MKINYKITTIILSAILLITYAWHWQDIFNHNSSENNMNMQSNKMSDMKNMHQMPNGQMMSNDGMNMGGMNMMDMTMTDMVKMMDGKTGKELEKEFITGMIPHHQGAVDMANKLLANPTVSPELKNFANQIISAQEGEIKMMNEWLKRY